MTEHGFATPDDPNRALQQSGSRSWFAFTGHDIIL